MKKWWGKDWFSKSAGEQAKKTVLEPGVTAVEMDQEDLKKNRTRAAAMDRDMPATEPVKVEAGKPSWKATPVEVCPKCGSNNVFVTASGKWCRAPGCGHKYALRTDLQLA